MSPQIRVAVKTARMLWFSLFISTFMFLVVYKMARHAPSNPPDTMVVAFVAAMAVVIASLSVVFPQRALATAIRRIAPKINTEAGEAIGSFRESASVRKVIADPEGAVRATLAPFMTSFTTGMALAEAVALLGFALGYMGEPPKVMAPFFLVAWVVMASKLPRIGAITRAIERATGAECPLQ